MIVWQLWCDEDEDEDVNDNDVDAGRLYQSPSLFSACSLHLSVSASASERVSVSPSQRCHQHHWAQVLVSFCTHCIGIIYKNPSSPEQVAKRPGRYDEMPKSATMENRQNMEQHVRADLFFFLWIVWFPSLTTLSLSVLCNGPATEESWADPLLEWLRGGHDRAAEESGPLPGELSTFYLLSLGSQPLVFLSLL